MAFGNLLLSITIKKWTIVTGYSINWGKTFSPVPSLKEIKCGADCPKRASCSGRNTSGGQEQGFKAQCISIKALWPWGGTAFTHLYFVFWNIRWTHTDLAFYYTKKPFPVRSYLSPGITLWGSQATLCIFQDEDVELKDEYFLGDSLLVWDEGKTGTQSSWHLLSSSVHLTKPTQPPSLWVRRTRRVFICKKGLQSDYRGIPIPSPQESLWTPSRRKDSRKRTGEGEELQNSKGWFFPRAHLGSVGVESQGLPFESIHAPDFPVHFQSFPWISGIRP